LPLFPLAARWPFIIMAACLAWSAAPAQQRDAPAAAPAATPEQLAAARAAERQIILACTSDAYNSLHIAATYFEVAGRSQEKTMSFASQAGEPGRAIAGDLFNEVAAGTVRSAARFATVRLFKCLEVNKFPMDAEVGAPLSDICWARSEVIHHSSVLKAQSKTREEALASLQARFRDTRTFPPSFLEGVNNLIYERNDNAAQVRDSQKSFYWTCLRADRPAGTAAKQPGAAN
jgi:hypothetical protein